MVAKKLHLIMKEVGSIGKDSSIDTRKGSYMVRSEEAVLSAIRPLFVKYGLVMYPVEIRTERTGQLTCLNVDYVIYDTEDDDTIKVSAYGEGYDAADKGAGKALTYATKNMLVKLVLAVSGEDSDNKSSDAIVDEQNEVFEKFNAIIARIDKAKIPGDNKALLKTKASKYTNDSEMLDNINKYLDSINL